LICIAFKRTLWLVISTLNSVPNVLKTRADRLIGLSLTRRTNLASLIQQIPKMSEPEMSNKPFEPIGSDRN